ncbi:SpaH/EbpB family LPXTG-anchored major pilin [Vagococcus acidifermentans]|uniref:Gram-positive cocci surface proteins LPxTG domain-containing protein n=1 Tax=Vagococcus acidifermentans TaxID=564710 RepID=A0A430ATX4_9ENTE|nr:SpaH/EbpB family LPXTG-anchored major pilin [Vagococcus acidifermentans]RSU11512.1 hypothetical protein CBF27_08450 [Vagococcus acidifermentans]
MKRAFTKLISVALAFLFMFVPIMNLKAEASSLPPEKGNLFIHKYYMEDISKAGLPNDGKETVVPDKAVPLSNISFKLYKVTPENGRYPEGKSVVVDATALTVTDEDVTYKLAEAVEVKTDDTGLATAKDLAQGVYVVVEQPAEPVTIDGKEINLSPVEPFVTHVPMTNPEGNGWLTDVHVYPKNEGLVAEKVGGTSLSNQIGDIMSYRINTKVPNGVYDANEAVNAKIKYGINDTLDAALTLQQDTVKVYLTDELTGKTTEDKLLVAGVDYNLVSNPSFTVDFTDVGRKKLSDSKYVAITFDAKVNEKILSKKDVTTVDNTAVVDFTNKNGDNITTETPAVTIHTSTVQIEKISARDSSKLAGATFQIASSEANAKAGKFLKKDKDGNVLDVGATGYDEAGEWAEITDAQGVASFKGVKDYTSVLNEQGKEEQITYLSYWIVETKAPAGYHLLDAPVQVTFNEETSAGENPMYTVKTQIKNSKKGLLPKTGSMTAIVLSISGIIVLGVGVMLNIIFSKKKHA